MLDTSKILNGCSYNGQEIEVGGGGDLPADLCELTLHYADGHTETQYAKAGTLIVKLPNKNFVVKGTSRYYWYTFEENSNVPVYAVDPQHKDIYQHIQEYENPDLRINFTRNLTEYMDNNSWLYILLATLYDDWVAVPAYPNVEFVLVGYSTSLTSSTITRNFVEGGTYYGVYWNPINNSLIVGDELVRFRLNGDKVVTLEISSSESYTNSIKNIVYSMPDMPSYQMTCTGQTDGRTYHLRMYKDYVATARFITVVEQFVSVTQVQENSSYYPVYEIVENPDIGAFGIDEVLDFVENGLPVEYEADLLDVVYFNNDTQQVETLTVPKSEEGINILWNTITDTDYGNWTSAGYLLSTAEYPMYGVNTFYVEDALYQSESSLYAVYRRFTDRAYCTASHIQEGGFEDPIEVYYLNIDTGVESTTVERSTFDPSDFPSPENTTVDTTRVCLSSQFDENECVAIEDVATDSNTKYYIVYYLENEDRYITPDEYPQPVGDRMAIHYWNPDREEPDTRFEEYEFVKDIIFDFGQYSFEFGEHTYTGNPEFVSISTSGNDLISVEEVEDYFDRGELWIVYYQDEDTSKYYTAQEITELGG